MTPRPLLWAAIVAAAVILAIVALLASGSFAPAATSREASHAASPAETLRGAPLDPAPVPATATGDARPVGFPLSPEAAYEPSVGSPTSIPAPSGGVGTALVSGWASWADPDLGDDYLAMRLPRGTWVRICGVASPDRCWTTTTNDYGPSKRIVPSRVADIGVLHWEHICGLPRARGVCLVTIETVDAIALPATDQEAP